MDLVIDFKQRWIIPYQQDTHISDIAHLAKETGPGRRAGDFLLWSMLFR